MTSWKRTLLFGGGIGAGSILAVAVIAVGAYYFLHRVKPWNKAAITAEYDRIQTEGANHSLVFGYTLNNNTDQDFELPDHAEIRLAGKLKAQNALSFSNNDGNFEHIELPIFAPAHSRVRIRLVVAYPFTSDEPMTGSKDERHDWETNLTRFVTTAMPNLDGFVLLDPTHRYEVDLPNGWERRSKEALRVASIQ
jgi:hypothetical protein